MKTTILLFVIFAAQVSADDCKGKERVKLGQDLLMRCHNGLWKPVQRKSGLASKPCEDNSALSANATCSADRGHCSQFTDKGAEMDRSCPGTCESCDACRCQDSHQWHTYCPYWTQYCGSTGVLGTWMTSNCRKSCGKCKCKCCSFEGIHHKLGSRISLPEKCGVLECQESLIAESSPILPGAAVHNVSHPEELTLSFISLQDGADCCVLPHKAKHADGTSYDKDAMVEEGWGGSILMPKGPVKAFCCHGSLNVPLADVARVLPALTTTTATPTTDAPSCQAGWSLYGNFCYRFFTSGLNWFQAQEACSKENANLASIENSKENDFVSNLKTSGYHIWIGGSQPSGSPKDSGWTWTDHSAWTFENWGPLWDGNEHCIEIWNTNDGKWNDQTCTRVDTYVCKKHWTS